METKAIPKFFPKSLKPIDGLDKKHLVRTVLTNDTGYVPDLIKQEHLRSYFGDLKNNSADNSNNSPNVTLEPHTKHRAVHGGTRKLTESPVGLAEKAPRHAVTSSVKLDFDNSQKYSDGQLNRASETILLSSISSHLVTQLRAYVSKNKIDSDCRTEDDVGVSASHPHPSPEIPWPTAQYSSKHPDLQTISPDFLATLLESKCVPRIELRVIDCRYPYEYSGGRIRKAVNLYLPEQLSRTFLEPPPNGDRKNKRYILIFHCEFSSERGPRLMRYLRNEDRKLNIESYPDLFYPEMFLLEGGYKRFYEEYPGLCVPSGYVSMLDDVKKCSVYKKQTGRGKTRSILKDTS